jgi:hypothetical protein
MRKWELWHPARPHPALQAFAGQDANDQMQFSVIKSCMNFFPGVIVAQSFHDSQLHTASASQ